ncbi:MAG: sulfatase-like hydrolase/transferase [Actinomycetota bacterium]
MGAAQPNILFLYADQHRADVLGCAGNDVVVTPHLDRLALEGVRCTAAWTESPICQPARASMLTCRYPTDHGILGNFAGESSPDWDTVPQAIRSAGYDTASIGKTHYASWPMGPNGPEDTPPPTDEWIGSFGFDHVVEEFDRYVHVGRHDTPYMRFLRDRDALEPYRDTVQARFRAGDRHWEAVTSPLPQELDLTSFLGREAESWLRGRTGERPWFLQLSFVQPHVPLMRDPEWAAHYAHAEIARTAPARPSTDHHGWDAHLDLLRRHSHSELLSDSFVLAGARQYYAMVSLIDQQIGALVQLLEQRGELDDTMVIYAADHGEMLGDHGLMAKMNFYRSSVTIPLIVRPPGGRPSVIHDSPVQAIDVAATMLDAAGVAVPAAGRSLAPLANNDRAVGDTSAGPRHRDTAASMIRMRPGLPTWIAVTDGDVRCTFDRHSLDVVEVFDLTADADEETNLVGDVSRARVEGLVDVAHEQLGLGLSSG